MSEHNQHEEVIDQDISALTKISLLYDNSIAVKSLTLGVPWFGGAIDLILSKKGKEFVQRRSEIFFNDLKSRIEKLEQFEIVFKDEEGFYDLFNIAYEQVIKTRSEEKIRRFALLVSNCVVGEQMWDEAEAAVRLISELTDTHICILKAVSEVKLSEDEGFKGVRIASIVRSSLVNNAPSLQSIFVYLSEDTLKMYCSELISKALLSDAGVGKWNVGTLDLVAPTALGDWLLAKIHESDS